MLGFAYTHKAKPFSIVGDPSQAFSPVKPDPAAVIAEDEESQRIALHLIVPDDENFVDTSAGGLAAFTLAG